MIEILCHEMKVMRIIIEKGHASKNIEKETESQSAIRQVFHQLARFFFNSMSLRSGCKFFSLNSKKCFKWSIDVFNYL